MPNILEGKDGDLLLRRIEDGKCTPFPGSGACSEKIPVSSQIANELETKYDYPMEDSDEIHGVLADLPLPVYITTTYDDLKGRALKSRIKEPIQEMCRWNKCIKQCKPTSSDFPPIPEKSLVYHLHGCYEIPESLVLTEDVSEAQKEKAQKYLDRYFEDLHIQVYWHDCREFASELRMRWEDFNSGT